MHDLGHVPCREEFLVDHTPGSLNLRSKPLDEACSRLQTHSFPRRPHDRVVPALPYISDCVPGPNRLKGGLEWSLGGVNVVGSAGALDVVLPAPLAVVVEEQQSLASGWVRVDPEYPGVGEVGCIPIRAIGCDADGQVKPSGVVRARCRPGQHRRKRVAVSKAGRFDVRSSRASYAIFE